MIQEAPGLPDSDRGIRRVMNALERFPLTQQFKIFHVNGRLDRLTRAIERWDGDYVIVQYVLRGSLRPSTSDWLNVWRSARVVWSYYDLPAFCAEDGNPADFNFYHAPLGLDAAFQWAATWNTEKRFSVVTHGDYLTQSTRECVLASPRKTAHLGEPFDTSADVEFFTDVEDWEVARAYACSEFVAALRRKEGFELPGIEGLACGARPIAFDDPRYRTWLGEHAVYVREGTREDVLEQLYDVLRTPRPVTESESHWARQRFDWTNIIRGLYDHL